MLRFRFIAFIYSAVISSFGSTSVSAMDAFQIGLSGSLIGGATTVGNSTVAELQAGGHDPKQSGFNITNVELSFQAAVDPYLDAQANIVHQIDQYGETVVELEEAYFITRALPWGLQIKGGQFFTEFGRLNSSHPHSWWFVDQPVINSRVLGPDGTRAPGARISWLIPLSWYSELSTGIQNPAGETQASFISNGSGIGGYGTVVREAKSARDFLHSMRWLNGIDVSDTVSANVGLSILGGANNLGTESRTRITGIDTYLKWQPETSVHGFPFVAWHTEWLNRNMNADSYDTLTATTLEDQGLVSQIVWGYAPRYVAGMRYEFASATNGDTSDWQRSKRVRIAVNWTWLPTEFSKIRLQYNFDKTDSLSNQKAHGVWVQVEYNIGSHMAHVF